MRILFICHGNICRSPMAEYIMKELVKREGVAGDWEIESAAVSREEIGNPVYPPAREELARHSISCEGKRAVQLKKSDYDKYDYLIGMDTMNIRNIEKITGHRGGKIKMLLEYTGSTASVIDPWYSRKFDDTYRDIVTGCKAFLEYLQKQGKIEES